MDKMKLAPSECLVFEDVLEAIKSAKKTGAIVYGVKDKYSLKFEKEIIAVSDGYINDFSHAPKIKNCIL